MNAHALASASHKTNTPRSARSATRASKNTHSVHTNASDDVAYLYDGSLEGLLSAIFQAYARHENPRDILRTCDAQPRLGQRVVAIETNLNEAVRVQRGITRAAGKDAFNAICNAALSDEVHAGTAAYRFVRYALQVGEAEGNSCNACPRRGKCGGVCTSTKHSSVLSRLTHPAVEPLVRIAKAVANERHRMLQFIRFEHLENDVWFARCNPNASVVPLIMNHFCARFNTQQFIIYDENHRIAGVYEGRDWYLVHTDRLRVPQAATDEKLMRAAWKRFYNTVAVESRYNPELRRQFMPKRLWTSIVEMQEELPGTDIEPSTQPNAKRQGNARYKTPVKSNGGMKLSSAASPSCQK